MRKIIQRIVCAALVAGIAGCAAAPVPPRIVWPVPPDEPKVEFIGAYASENDFPKTRGEKRLEAVIGESSEARFKSPFGIVADGRGTVYISDLHDHNIRVYDFNRRSVDFFSKEPVFEFPMGLALDSRGRLYVADSRKGMVMVFDAAGRKPLFTIGDKETAAKPVFLALHEALGRLYVSDGQENRIVVYDLEGKHLFSFGSVGGEHGQFFAPQGLAFSPDGLLYVADNFNARVQAFTADGEFVRSFGERGDQSYQFESPTDLDFDSEGNLWVVDGRRGQIQTYTPDGTLLLVTGEATPTGHPLGFGAPRGIHIDQNDRIYVADMINKRFSVWQYFDERYRQSHPFTAEDKARLDEALKKQAEGKAKDEK